ncbi:hypothetical protein [Mucilaginibacter pedocola]|uniref:Uncharacterized protein n=1 Tax=Mucilaginibacter pedocola TaxID=1792845 RepID=A0A1S9P9A9_9SPHI|nr:hypothetical protein [Mucilaginibacter pedocola]OOQ57417.1 hypothetical protein BC343_15070 [Mucilaginibacter pedocola]
MAPPNAKQILSNLYGLMMEINYHRPDEEVLEDLKSSEPQLEKHLLKIKQLSAKIKANQNKSRFENAVEMLRKLKEKGIEELEKLLPPLEQSKLIPLFNRFQELTKQDEANILADQELLQLIELIKDKIDDSPSQ